MYVCAEKEVPLFRIWTQKLSMFVTRLYSSEKHKSLMGSSQASRSKLEATVTYLVKGRDTLRCQTYNTPV